MRLRNMISIKIFMLLVICTLIVLYGCGGRSNIGNDVIENEELEWTTTGSLIDGTADIYSDEVPKAWNLIEGFTEIKDAIYDINQNTENNMAHATETENIVYTCTDRNVYFYDKTTNSTPQVLCSIPNCGHTIEEECPGALSVPCIQYYEGYIYLIIETMSWTKAEDNTDEENFAVEEHLDLYRVTPDGSSRTWVQTLVECEFGNGAGTLGIRFVIDQGYVYYWYNISPESNPVTESNLHANGSFCVYRVELGRNEDGECVMLLPKAVYTSEVQMASYGGDLFLVVSGSEYAKSDSDTLLYRICTDQEYVEVLTSSESMVSSGYHIRDGIIYYWAYQSNEMTGDNTTEPVVRMYDSKTGEDMYLWNFEDSTHTVVGIYVDDNYWYVHTISAELSATDAMFVLSSIQIYDMDFSYLGTVEVTGFEDYYDIGYLYGEDQIYIIVDEMIAAYIEKDQFSLKQFEVCLIGEE